MLETVKLNHGKAQNYKQKLEIIRKMNNQLKDETW